MKRLFSGCLSVCLSSRCNLIIYIHVRSDNLSTQHKDEVRKNLVITSNSVRKKAWTYIWHGMV